jgi:hypothetical protein
MKIIYTLILMTISIYASNISIIINKNSNISTLSKKEIKDIFLLNKQFVNSTKVIPLNVLGDSEERSSFEKKIMEMDKEDINRYWIKKHFQGVTPPLTQQSFESIKLFILNVDGSIGYIPSSLVDKNVRVIYEF